MDEGGFAQVSCIVTKGDQPLTISWFFHGSHITSDLGIMTSPIGGRGSMLIIGSIAHKHAGNYTCSAKNEAAIVTNTVELKVNGIAITGRHWIIMNNDFLLPYQFPKHVSQIAKMAY